MAAADLDPTAALCMGCGVRGCPLKHIPQAHKIRPRWWPFGRGRRD